MAQHRRHAGSHCSDRPGAGAVSTKAGSRMRRTQLAILILLVVVLGAAAWLLARRSTTSWQSNTGHLPDKVITLPIDQVAEVTIQQPRGQLHLKQQGDTWVVAEKANYPA